MQSQKRIELVTNAPDLPGLAYRWYHGEEDHRAILNVLNTANAEDHIPCTYTEDWLEGALKTREGFNPTEDMILATIFEEVVAYGMVVREQLGGEARFTLSGKVRPDWRSEGIGRSLIEVNEAHLLADSHPPRSITALCVDTEDTAVILYESLGYVLDGATHMDERHPGRPQPLRLTYRKVLE